MLSNLTDLSSQCFISWSEDAVGMAHYSMGPCVMIKHGFVPGISTCSTVQAHSGVAYFTPGYLHYLGISVGNSYRDDYAISPNPDFREISLKLVGLT